MNVTPPCGAGSSVVASTAAPSLGTPALSGARQTSVRSAWSATKTVTGMPYCRMYGGLTGIVLSRVMRRSLRVAPHRDAVHEQSPGPRLAAKVERDGCSLRLGWFRFTRFAVVHASSPARWGGAIVVADAPRLLSVCANPVDFDVRPPSAVVRIIRSIAQYICATKSDGDDCKRPADHTPAHPDPNAVPVRD